MSNKKLILCKFIFFIGMCVLYSCSWQGLELYFYGKITTEDLLEGFWTLLDFGNSIREVLNFLKKNLNRNLITNLGCKFSNYFSIAYFYILFYFTKEENKCKT